MRRRGSMLEMRGAQGSQGSQGASLSGSDNSINSVPTRRSTITRRSFGDPPPLPGKKAVVVNPVPRGGAATPGTATPPRATAPSAPAVPSAPSTPPAVGGPAAPFSSGRVTIVHRPTKEARKAEIVAAVTKRLYTQKKKPEPGSAGWAGPWPGAGRPDYPGVGGCAITAGSALPDTSEETEDEPKELKLCSNARARLQEISKRALALHLHRKRRDQEVQTEGPGVLRVKEKACGTDTRTDDKACQHPHPFYLQPFWGLGLGLGLGPVWGQRQGCDETFSDDSLEPTPDAGLTPAASPEPEPPPCGTLMRAYTLRSGGRFEIAAVRAAAQCVPRITDQSSQTGLEPVTVRGSTLDVGTSIACDAATMTMSDDSEPPARDVATMTFGSDDKATMTSQAADAAVMTTPEEPAFKDAGTATAEDTPRERNVGTMTDIMTDTVTDECERATAAGPSQQQTLVCDVRLCYQPSASASATCSYRLALPAPAPAPTASPALRPPSSPNVLSSGQHIPSGATDDRPPVSGKQGSRGNHALGPGSQGVQAPRLPDPAAAAPPDIIAEAGPSPGAVPDSVVDKSLAAVVTVPLHHPQHRLFSLEIVRASLGPHSLDAQLDLPASQHGLEDKETTRSRSLDNLPLNVPVGAPEAAVPAPSTPDLFVVPPPDSMLPDNVFPQRKFRLPYLADTVSGSMPRPSATARPIREEPKEGTTASDVPLPDPHPPPSPRVPATLTPKQRRLLANLLNVRPERRRRAPVPRRHRPSPSVPDVGKQAVLQSMSSLLDEAAVFVRTAKGGLTKGSLPWPFSPTAPPEQPMAPPPPVPLPSPPLPPPPSLMTSCTQTETTTTVEVSSKSTQSIADVGSQCSLLVPRGVSSRSRASQCTLPARTTASSATQCTGTRTPALTPPRRPRPWEDGDLASWDIADDDLTLAMPPPRKAESMSNLYSHELGLGLGVGLGLFYRPRNSRPSHHVLARYPRRPPPTCIHPDHHHHHHHPQHRGLGGPSLNSPKQYLHHLVTLRRGVVLASRDVADDGDGGGCGRRGRGWYRGGDDGRATFPS